MASRPYQRWKSRKCSRVVGTGAKVLLSCLNSPMAIRIALSLALFANAFSSTISIISISIELPVLAPTPSCHCQGRQGYGPCLRLATPCDTALPCHTPPPGDTPRLAIPNNRGGEEAKLLGSPSPAAWERGTGGAGHREKALALPE